jgi:hypothetical protein
MSSFAFLYLVDEIGESIVVLNSKDQMTNRLTAKSVCVFAARNGGDARAVGKSAQGDARNAAAAPGADRRRRGRRRLGAPQLAAPGGVDGRRPAADAARPDAVAGRLHGAAAGADFLAPRRRAAAAEPAPRAGRRGRRLPHQHRPAEQHLVGVVALVRVLQLQPADLEL